jgi:hypothetical protein
MNNPKDQIASYLNSLSRTFSLEGSTLKVEDASIEFQPSIDAAECSRVKMLMAKKTDANAFHNSAMMIVLISKMTGPDFNVDSFLDGMNHTDDSISTTHGGVSVSVDPTTNPWVIDFKPA